MPEDVTDRVRFSAPDDDALPLLQCVCGACYEAWDVILRPLEDDLAVSYTCSTCKRRLYFENNVRVYALLPEE